MKLKLFLIIIAMCLANSAWAATYYVAPTGNDSAAGTEAAPWKTPRRALTHALRPGDTVIFRGGDYLIDRYLVFTRDGSASAPITYKNYTGEKPTIVYNVPSGSTTGRVPIAFISGEYSIVDGINFRLPEPIRRRVLIDNEYVFADGRQNPESVSGPAIYGGHSILRNCSVDNFSGSGVFSNADSILVENCRITNNGSHGLYIRSRNSVFRYNFLDGKRSYWNQQGFQMQYINSVGNKVYGNLIMNGQASGFVMSGRLARNEVFNNIFINPGGKTTQGPGYAINFFCEDGIPRPGNKIYNNTFIGVSKSGLIAGGTCTTGLTACNFHSPDGLDSMTRAECNAELALNRPLAAIFEIRDNIFYPSRPVPITQIAGGLNRNLPNIRNNIFYNVSGSVLPGNTLVNPNLVNPTGGTAADAMLQASSPAIDKVTSGAPALDYRSGTRPVGAAADIGAYEFGAPPGTGGGPLGGGDSGGGDVLFPCI